MHQAVEDRVGQRWISQGLMPVLEWSWAGDQRGPAIMPIFDDLEQVTTIVFTERRQAPVIQKEQVRLGQGRQQFPIASVPFGHGQFWEESRESEVECAQAFTACLLAQRAAEPGFTLLMTMPSWD